MNADGGNAWTGNWSEIEQTNQIAGNNNNHNDNRKNGNRKKAQRR